MVVHVYIACATSFLSRLLDTPRPLTASSESWRCGGPCELLRQAEREL